jgi:DNA-binding beta-propeller fold protein YncE/mono/diheme cytochrome c family protein
VPAASIPVGLEPVTVVARTATEAWVVNNLSDTVSIVDLGSGTTVRTLAVGDAPTDVVFAAGKAFVAVSHEDAVKAYDLTNLSAAPVVVRPFASKIRALATNGVTVYAVAQDSGNQTTVIDANVAFGNNANLNATRLAALGLNDMKCSTPPPPYPAMPAGISRNPALIDPPDGIPHVGLIVKWDPATGAWRDDASQNWTNCLPFRLPDHDLFAINAASPGAPPVAIDHLGTTLFDVSINPASGKVYVPNTEAQNFVRFEPRVKGHVVDDRLSIVNPASGNAVTLVDLNTHIDRASDPATNLAERTASISQPGMMVWRSDGSIGYMTAIGSRKLFAVDGGCSAGSCIFGPIHHAGRSSPDAVEVGEGPTGVALLESKNRLYVLNRFSNSIALVDAPTLTKVGEIALHDPSSAVVKQGRRFLYDGILSSGHGDAACSSCHISGDKDGIGWDLGDPTGDLAPYNATNDNVRFVVPLGNQPTACDPSVCASHAGFDPQKGPMSTQTLRAMLEPLHWRGDRATMNDFNPAFVALLGAQDVGPVNGRPAGLSAADMETFRQFALGMRFPPNPNRNVDDTLPNASVPIPPTALTGNPSDGETKFNTLAADANQHCSACHALPFGAAGGKLGGVTPQEPTTAPDAAALFNGNADGSPHSDLKIPHLRNLVDKAGFLFGPPGGPYPDVKSGFSFVHDGTIPNIPTFLSINVFNLTATDVKDISAFMLAFPTGIKPAVGANLTLPQGTPPTGTASDESLLATLLSLGDLGNAARHCELTASALVGGRMRSYRLSGGVWLGDVAGEPALSTTALRQAAQGPIGFLCATIGSGLRLGGDRDEDAVLNGNDCAPADPSSWAPPSEVGGLSMQGKGPTAISWSDQAPGAGPGMRYDVAGGTLSALRASGIVAATSCIAGDLTAPAFSDTQAAPAPGDGYYYVIRAENGCGSGSFGPGRSSLDPLACSSP